MLMVEGRYDPDRLVSAVVADGMSGEEFACYMMISTLVFSRGGAVPDRETRDKLQTIFHMRAPQLNSVISRLKDLGRLTIERGWMDARLPAMGTRSASTRVAPPAPTRPPAKPRLSPPPKPISAPPSQEKKNGFALDLFPETLPKPPPSFRSPDPIPIPKRSPDEPPSLPLSPDAIRDNFRPEFDIWYGGYPHKKAPEDALRAYIKARKKATFDELMAGRDLYAASVKGQEKHLIKHPATWLNKGCWKDEYEAPTQEDRAWV